MQVGTIMTWNPACATPDASLHDVARMMEENDCGCIPVVDSHTSMKPVGTITDRDITIRTVAANQNPINMKASDIMTKSVATVEPQMSVEECFNVMEDKEIRRVLVVDEEGKCCGIVAQADIVQSTANPIRTNKVIREISESAPSSNAGMYRRRSGGNGHSHSDKGSFLSSGSLYPLLIGLGSGAALGYLLNNRQDQKRPVANLSTSSYQRGGRLDQAGRQEVGMYADAEQEVEKRQHNLQDRLHSVRSELETPSTEMNSQVGDRPNSVDQTDKPKINDKGRSAGQGN